MARSAWAIATWAAAVGTLAVGAGALAQDVIDATDLGEGGLALEADTNNAAIWNLDQLGDVNGDGFDDIGLGGHEPFGNGDRGWRVTIVYGRPAFTGRWPLLGLVGTTVIRAAEGVDTGRADHVATVGDLDGDGFSDILFSFTSLRLLPELGRGAAFLVYGARDLGEELSAEAIGTEMRGHVIYSTDPQVEGIGRNAAMLRDFNGDGRRDLAIAAPFSSPFGRESAGTIFILFEPTDLPVQVDLSAVGTSIPGMQIHGWAEPATCCGALGHFGIALEDAGDFDGDGLTDLLTSATEVDPDSVFLIRGRRDLPSVFDLELLAQDGSLENVTRFKDWNESGRIFGAVSSIAGAGDVNGDGFDDILIGAAKQCCSFLVDADSEVFLFYGRREFPPVVEFSQLSPELGTSFRPVQSQDSFGLAVAAPGDLNGDGIGDFLFGAERASIRGQDTGEAYVVHGQAQYGAEVRLADGFSGLRMRGEGSFNNFGAKIVTAGDFNGDGARDILVNARHHSSFSDDPSRAYVIYGIGGGPAPLRVHRVEPRFGPLRGVEVIIHGSGFLDGPAPRVAFGGQPSLRVQVLAGGRLSALAPLSTGVGPVDVVLSRDAESARLVSGFEYTPNFPDFDLADLGDAALELAGDADHRVRGGATFGDVTGDGVDDVAAGFTSPEGPRVIVVRGGKGLPRSIDVAQPSGPISVLTLGAAEGSVNNLELLGDVNGDGIRDLGIAIDAKAFVLFGRDGLPAHVELEDEVLTGLATRLESRQGTAKNLRLAPLGDFDEDGFPDIALSVAEGEPLAAGPGRLVLLGGRAAWPEAVDIDGPGAALARIVPPAGEVSFGTRLSGTGDVDGDGVADLLAVTVTSDTTGVAYLLRPRRGAPADGPVAEWIASGVATRLELPLRRHTGRDALNQIAISRAGDTDGDGLADLLVGYPGGGEENEGVTFLVPGRAKWPASLPLLEAPPVPDGAVRLYGGFPRLQSGGPAPIGDFNGDGFADFALRSSNPFTSGDFSELHGVLYLVLGGAQLRDVRLESIGGRGIVIEHRPTGSLQPQGTSWGDVNADGQPDFAFSESRFRWSDGAVETERLVVLFGPYGGRQFQRGDANSSGLIDIGDAIFILSYLFLGGPEPFCADAADIDDDGAHLITDAVYLLGYLFLGDGAPPPPHAQAGDDPTPDGLDCVGF